MPRPDRFARIAITLPRDVLKAADRQARALGRSRSWVIADAVRRYAREITTGVEPVAPMALRPGLGESRRAQLIADLRLTPEQRVREAEETLPASARSRGRRPGILGFDRYEDYLDWKRFQDLGA